MTFSANPSQSASGTEPLRIRRRTDLLSSRQVQANSGFWVLKDPISRRYFRLDDQEYALWSLLDGQRSPARIAEQFRRQFPTTGLNSQQVSEFATEAVQGGLAIALRPGEGVRLYERGVSLRRRQRIGQLASLLAIRMRLFDPDQLLETFFPAVRWLIQPWAVLVSAFLMLTATGLVVVHWAEFHARLPGWGALITPWHAAVLLGVLIITKCLHELGHAMVCKRFGGEVHELGVLFLLFAPCLYCNVTDSWMFSSKWQRAAVGAAGMWVELSLASLATWLWWLTHPGLVQDICLSVMVVCSVQTLLFNANPLLRFDGYYILSDLTGVANLRQKASDVLTQTISWVFLGRAYPTRSADLRPFCGWLLFVYALAAAAYRWVLLVTVVWVLEVIFRPYRLEVIGRLVAIVGVGSLLLGPMIGIVSFFSKQQHRKEVSIMRLIATMGLLVWFCYALLNWPLPHRVLAPVVVGPGQAARVYVQTPGRLQGLAQEGDFVEPGSPLARLTNEEVQQQLAATKRQLLNARESLRRLETQRHNDPDATVRLPVARQQLADLKQELADRQRDAGRLVLRSPMAGRVLPPPRTEKSPQDDELPNWWGTPLQTENRSAWLESGSLFCLVGDPRACEALLLIDQTEIEYVRPGQKVTLLFRCLPGQRWSGTIAEVAEVDLQAIPPQLSAEAAGPMATRADPRGRQKPLAISYLARVDLHDPQQTLRPGLTGLCKVEVGQRTWGQWLARTASETLNFRW